MIDDVAPARSVPALALWSVLMLLVNLYMNKKYPMTPVVKEEGK